MRPDKDVPRPESDDGIGRRTFLGIGWTAVAANLMGVSGAVLRFLLPNVLFEPPAAFKLGKPADYAPESVTFVPERKIFVIRLQDGAFKVVTATCPHLRCVVRWAPDRRRYECPCHGSRFSERGKVAAGPAPSPLEWFEVTLATDGRLYVNTRVQVNPDYRLVIEPVATA